LQAQPKDIFPLGSVIVIVVYSPSCIVPFSLLNASYLRETAAVMPLLQEWWKRWNNKGARGGLKSGGLRVREFKKTEG